MSTEACFVPVAVASNMTDEEFVREMRDCLPAAIVARMCELENSVPAECFAAAMKASGALEEMKELLANAGIDLDDLPDFGTLTLAEATKLVDKLGDAGVAIKDRIATALDALEEIAP